MSEHLESGSGEERTRLDRRTAMRVALGGAAAGAAFMAPRIEGLSVAPDYAAAATACTLGPAGTSVNIPGPARKDTFGVGCGYTRCWAMCFAGNVTTSTSVCDRSYSCPNNAGNFSNTDSNGVTNGLALNLLGSELRYAVAGSQKWTGNYCGNWSNDSRSHMKINTVASPFANCDATMSIACNQGFTGRMRDRGTDNNNHNNDIESSSPTSWTRNSNDNATTAWNTRWILGCEGFRPTNPNPIANGSNGVTNGVSSVTINFKCYCP